MFSVTLVLRLLEIKSEYSIDQIARNCSVDKYVKNIFLHTSHIFLHIFNIFPQIFPSPIKVIFNLLAELKNKDCGSCFHLVSPPACVWRSRKAQNFLSPEPRGKIGIFPILRAYVEGQSSKFLQVPRTFSRMWRHEWRGGLEIFESGVGFRDRKKHETYRD